MSSRSIRHAAAHLRPGSYRMASNHPRRTRPSLFGRPLSPRWMLLLPLVLGGLLIVACVAWRDQSKPLGYGPFKRKLAAGEVARVKVGPSEITGDLKPGADGRRVAFRVSRVGLERDERLAELLDRYVPGDYDTDPGPAIDRAAVLPLVILASLLVGLGIVLW